MPSQINICINKTYNHLHRATLWKSRHQEDEVSGGVPLWAYQSKDYSQQSVILWSSPVKTRAVP